MLPDGAFLILPNAAFKILPRWILHNPAQRVLPDPSNVSSLVLHKRSALILPNGLYLSLLKAYALILPNRPSLIPLSVPAQWTFPGPVL